MSTLTENAQFTARRPAIVKVAIAALVLGATFELINVLLFLPGSFSKARTIVRTGPGPRIPVSQIDAHAATVATVSLVFFVAVFVVLPLLCAWWARRGARGVKWIVSAPLVVLLLISLVAFGSHDPFRLFSAIGGTSLLLASILLWLPAARRYRRTSTT